MLRRVSEPTSPGAADVEPPTAPPSTHIATVPIPIPPVAPGSAAAPDASAPTILTPPGPAANTHLLPPPGPSAPSGQALPAGVAAYATPAGGGTSGLAIAALVCGIVGFVPLVAVVAIVLGIVALNHVRARGQNGRGLAIAGIVLGSLWILVWAAVVAVGVMSGPERDTKTGVVSAGQTVLITDLKVGDCFSGLPAEDDAYVDTVTTKACTSPHDAQLATTLVLPAGEWPGADKAAEMAGEACADKVDPLISADRYGDVDLSYIYPSTAFDWHMDRTVQCIFEGANGPLTGSVLRAG
jgi:hypothetical protein